MSVLRSSGLSMTQSSNDGLRSLSSTQELNRLRDNYGHIESLSISNFKSYFGETRIGPFTPFTCIIGPNGSGKSNLMDAISFVLGIKTSHLRGKKLTDLIHRINFNSSSNDPSSQSQSEQPTKAYVELVYISKKLKQREREDDEDDDLESQRDREQSDDNEFEEERMVFRRTITDRGSTINEYNGERMDFKSYEEKLSQIGVIVRARNFLVFQGDVTGIAQKTGKDLTKWFEQISGSDLIKPEFEEAVRKHAEVEFIANAHFEFHVQTRYEAAGEKNRNLAREKKQMKQQKEEATEFELKKKELKALKSEFFRYQLFNILNDVKEAQESIETVDEEIEGHNLDLKELEDNIKLRQAALSKAIRKKTNINKNLKKYKQALNKKKLKAGAMEKQCDILKEEEKKLNDAENELTEKMEDNEQELVELKQQMDDIKEKQDEYEEDLKDEDEDIELEENQYEIYQDIKHKICQETASMNLQKSSLNSVYSRKKDEFDVAQDEMNVLNGRQEKFDNTIDELTEKITNLDGDIKKTESEYKEMQKEYGELIEANEELKNQRVKVNDSLSKLLHEVKEMDIGIQDNKRQKQQTEVLQTLQKLFNGIYGKLCDLIEVRQQKFNLAVAVGLGINHDAVVVEDKETAKQCMIHMRKTRRGHFRFIPLNNIKTYPVSQELRRFPGTSKPMMDVIKYEPQFERAVEFALNNTVVVDTMNEARDIAYNLAQNLSNNSDGNNNGPSKRIRVVCLDGSIIQPNGNISGGYSRDFKDKARRFNEKERNKKMKRRDDLLQKLRNIDDQLSGDMDDDEDGKKSEHEYKTLLTELENARKNKKLRLETFKKQLSEKEKQLKTLKKDIKSKKSKQKKLEKEVNEAKDKLDECDEEIIQKENEIFEAVADELGVDTIREYEEQKLQKIEERSSKRKEFNVQLTEKENKQKFIENKNKNNKDEIKKIQKRLKKLRKELRDIEGDKLKKLKKQIDKESNTVDNEEKKSDEIQDDVKEKRKAVSDANKEIVKKRNQRNEKMQEKGKLNGWISKIESTQKSILEQAKREQIELKRKKKRRKKKKASKAKPKKKGGHRRKRRKKNDGDSSDEAESDEEEEEHKTEDEDLTDSDAMSEDEEESEEEDFDDDMDVFEIMQRRMSNIDLSEFPLQDEDEDGMDVEDEEEEDQMDEIRKFEARKKRYKNEIDELTKEIAEMQPNMKALEQYKKLQIKHKDGSTDAKNIKKEVQKAWKEMEQLKDARSDKLRECFNIISNNIQKIYAQLTKSRQYKTGGRAFLDLSGSEPDPFNNSSIFNVMPPGKPFREMQQLSGGEKSVASLALLFAIHSYKPSPFFILDEIDAALDAKNVQKVCNYIRKKSKQNTQIIVISLKDKFFSNADSLIGVCKDRGNEQSGDCSKILSIDLRKYDSNNNNNNNRNRQRRSVDDDEKQQ